MLGDSGGARRQHWCLEMTVVLRGSSGARRHSGARRWQWCEEAAVVLGGSSGARGQRWS